MLNEPCGSKAWSLANFCCLAEARRVKGNRRSSEARPTAKAPLQYSRALRKQGELKVIQLMKGLKDLPPLLSPHMWPIPPTSSIPPTWLTWPTWPTWPIPSHHPQKGNSRVKNSILSENNSFEKKFIIICLQMHD